LGTHSTGKVLSLKDGKVFGLNFLWGNWGPTPRRGKGRENEKSAKGGKYAGLRARGGNTLDAEQT